MRSALLLSVLLLACGDDDGGADPDPITLDGPGAPGQQDEDGTLPTGDGGGRQPPPQVGDAPPPQVEPLTLEVFDPPRGHLTMGPTVRVVGEVHGGEAPTVSVGGLVVELKGDGSFAVEVPVVHGLNFLVVTVNDGARSLEDRRSVLVGADDDPTSMVPGAAFAEIGVDALASASRLLSDYLSDLDLMALVGPNLPEGVEVESLEHGGIEIAIAPADGHLLVTVAVNRLRASLAGTVSRFGASVTFRGSASTDPGRVISRVAVSANGRGELDVDILDAEVELHNFEYDIDGVPDVVEDWFAGWVRDWLEGFLGRTLAEYVIPQLFDASSLTRTIEVLGTPLELGLFIDEVTAHRRGLSVVVDATASASAVVHDGPALRPLDLTPQMDQRGAVDVALATDLLSRVFHAAWAGGLLDFALDETSDVELPINLTPALVAPALGQAGNGLDLSAPLFVRTRPLLPPVARVEDGERPVVLEIGDLLIDLSTPDGPLVTLAVQIEARAALKVAANDEIRLDPDLEVTVHADVAETPLGPVDEPRLEGLVEQLAALIPGMIAEDTYAFGTDFLPVPVSLEESEVSADPSGAHVHLVGDLR